ncbi:MAG: type secretion system protein GspE [Chthonomonadaceae bacterium]|nr:type secretion system protein GspE [Chthonomonadaceae bacterium]
MDLQQRAITYLKNEMDDVERQQFEEELTHSEALRMELEKGREVFDLLEAANETANVRRCNTILQQAIQSGASDIHILPGSADHHEAPSVSRVLFRIDGQLYEKLTLPGELHRPTIDRLKTMAECNLSERTLPQDGRIMVRYEGNSYEVRACFLPTINGERVTMRVLNRHNVLIGLDHLGLQPAQQETLLRLMERPYGFMITSGQVGTGKTTLLYSLLNAAQKPEKPLRNILTVEHPVEYRMPGLSQSNVFNDAGMTFPAILRSMLRCDPDIIYASEFRSLEMLELATEAALTGSLFLGQLHVSSALLIPQRMWEMGLVPFLAGQTLTCAIGQRLVRRICKECAAEYTPSPEGLQKLGLSATQDGPFLRGKGCEACHQTGFKGRIGLYEVWEVDEKARKLIAESAPVEALWKASFGQTGGSLWDDARAKVRQGITTVEEVTWALFDYPIPRLR